MLHKFLYIVAAITFLAATPAGATATAAKPYVFDKEPCDFQMSFPEKPVIEERCEGTDPKICRDIITYNYVFSLESAISVRFECKPSDEKAFNIINILDQRAVAENMAKKANILPSSIRTGGETDFFKTATVTGIYTPTTEEENERLFIGQLWVSKKSFMTMQIENSGPQNKDADQMIAELLSGLKPKDRILPKTKKVQQKNIQKQEKSPRGDTKNDTGKTDK